MQNISIFGTKGEYEHDVFTYKVFSVCVNYNEIIVLVMYLSIIM
jgi:hypothetical protein